MAQRQGLAQRELEHLLRARRERDLAGRDFVALTDDPRHLSSDLLDGDVERLQHPRSETFLLTEQAKQQMLGADVVVLQGPGFVLGKDDDLASSFGKALEQPSISSFQTSAGLGGPAVRGRAMVAHPSVATDRGDQVLKYAFCAMSVTGKALITGGAGFIGSHLAELLLRDGWEVFALDDLSTGSMANVAHLNDRRDFHLVVESVLSAAVVSELVHKCDVVYHLAAAVGVQLIVQQPGRTLLTNVRGTENVLDYCDRFGKRVLVASSSEVYGDHQEEEPLREDAKRIYGPTTARRWAYADSKAMDEFLALARHEERGLDCVIARLFNTVGPRQSDQYGMVVPRFVAAALAGQPLEVHGDGTQTRCFCHVADSVRALR